MKKSHIFLAFLIVAGIFISATLLHVFFCLTIEAMIQSILEATLTGCVLAIPTGVIVINEHRYENHKKLSYVLNEIDELLKQYQSTSNADPQETKRALIEQYNELCSIMQPNLLIHASTIAELQIQIFSVAEQLELERIGNPPHSISEPQTLAAAISSCRATASMLGRKI